MAVSYFEMAQNFNMLYWDEAEVFDRLKKKMSAAYHSVLNLAEKHKLNMRQAGAKKHAGRSVELPQFP